MSSFAAMFGDPLARYVIALHHTAVPSTALAAGVDVSRGPLLNPAVIAGWRPVSGIDVHWAVNPVMNLLALGMIGPTMVAADVLIKIGRAAGRERVRLYGYLTVVVVVGKKKNNPKDKKT